MCGRLFCSNEKLMLRKLKLKKQEQKLKLKESSKREEIYSASTRPLFRVTWDKQSNATFCFSMWGYYIIL